MSEEHAATPRLPGGGAPAGAAGTNGAADDRTGEAPRAAVAGDVVASENPVAAEPHAGLGRRNDRLLLAAVAGYAVVLSILMIARGISVTPDVIVVGFGLAALLLGRGRLFLRDWIPFLALFFAYELMRGYADKFGFAIHSTDIVAIERFISFGHLPTVALQQALHHGPATNPDPLAMLSVIFYFLHFPLPLAIGFLLWLHRRAFYYDFVAALIVLSIGAFVTYLVLPVAPPWWVVTPPHAVVSDPILHLRDNGFHLLAQTFGFGNYFYSYTSLYAISSNDVAAFPSLHAAYPFLAFLFARRAFGRAGWLMFLYTCGIWFAIVYLGEHWVVDIIGGVAYASVAYLAVLHGPGWVRRFLERAEDTSLDTGEAGDGGAAEGATAMPRRTNRRMVLEGALVAIVGAAVAFAMSRDGILYGTTTPLYLVPWIAILGGLWRGAAGLLSR